MLSRLWEGTIRGKQLKNLWVTLKWIVPLAQTPIKPAGPEPPITPPFTTRPFAGLIQPTPWIGGGAGNQGGDRKKWGKSVNITCNVSWPAGPFYSLQVVLHDVQVVFSPVTLSSVPVCPKAMQHGLNVLFHGKEVF
jgi:hypothetical protein